MQPFLVQLKYSKKKFALEKSRFVQSGPYTVQVCEGMVWGMRETHAASLSSQIYC